MDNTDLKDKLMGHFGTNPTEILSFCWICVKCLSTSDEVVTILQVMGLLEYVI